MSVMGFLSRLRDMSIKLRLEGDSLSYEAPKGAVTREILGEISSKKEEIMEFLRQIELEKSAAGSPIVPVPRDGENNFPLSCSQQSMWFFDQMTKGNPVFNISNAVRMSGTVEAEAIRLSLAALTQRYEPLRTTFSNVNGRPVQVINSEMETALHELDLKGMGTENIEEELKIRLRQEARHIFDLEKGPLFRFCLFTLDENEFVLSLTIHHIISDAWSNIIFVGEFFRAYKTVLEGKSTAFAPPEIQYVDYVLWEKDRLAGEEMNRSLEYWKKQLEKPTTLQLPTDYARPKSQTYEGGFQALELSPALVEKLKGICSKEGVTMFMLILSAFQTLLHRYSGQEDIFTGTVVANRGKKDTERLIGFLMNTLVLRTDFGGDPCFSDILKRVKRMTLDAYTHQELPFDRMLEEIKPERDVSRTPLFQVMFILHNTPEAQLELPYLKMRQISVESHMAPFDLRLQLTEGDDRLKGGFDYNAALFDPSTIKRMAAHLQELLEAVSSNPMQPVSRMDIITPMEREQLLNAFNDTQAFYPMQSTVSSMFEARAGEAPDSVAAIFEDEKATYGELNERAGRMAALLRLKGVGAESIVAVMLERSIEMIIAIMAVEKAGGAYLPIDPHYPEDRIAYMLEDSGAALLLSHKRFSDISVPEKIQRIFVEDQHLYSDFPYDEKHHIDPHSAAYVIYTSGSTGKPKGAVIEHHSLVNRLGWMQKMYPIDSSDTILQKTPFTFDVSVWEMFWWSAYGAKVCFLGPGEEKDPQKITEAIERHNITVMHFVPSMLQVFMDYIKDSGGVHRISSLKQVFASGEALTVSHVRLFKETMGKNGTRLANLYGPTEATIDVSYFNCSTAGDLDTVPIGKPIDNIKLFILDKNMLLQPIGVPGELCISGVGLARGYLNRPELTSQKFVDNPFFEGRKIYRTGDLARWREDGNIEYLGRMDFQVKVRGFRIELGEIEGAMLRHPAVKECIVAAWERKPGNINLVCYVVTDKESGIQPPGLQAFLEKVLPEYMVPKIYVFLDSMPVSRNGKADRKALPPPVLEKKESYAAPCSETEKALAEIWREELGLDNIGINDNFFEIGGHSLLLARVHSRIKKQFDRDFSLLDMFTHSTISSLAKYVTDGQAQVSFSQNEDRLRKQKEAKQRRKQMSGRG